MLHIHLSASKTSPPTIGRSMWQLSCFFKGHWTYIIHTCVNYTEGQLLVGVSWLSPILWASYFNDSQFPIAISARHLQGLSLVPSEARDTSRRVKYSTVSGQRWEVTRKLYQLPTSRGGCQASHLLYIKRDTPMGCCLAFKYLAGLWFPRCVLGNVLGTRPSSSCVLAHLLT